MVSAFYVLAENLTEPDITKRLHYFIPTQQHFYTSSDKYFLSHKQRSLNNTF